MAVMTAIQVLVNGFLLGGTYVLVAQSLNLIFGVMKVVNLAHGGFIVISGLFTFWAVNRLGIPPLAALPVVFVGGALLGALLEPLIIEPLMGRGKQSELLSLIVTFGLNYVLTQIALFSFGTDYVSVPYLQATLNIGGVIVSGALLLAGLFAGVITLLLYFGLKHTYVGKSLLAASQSTIGAQSCGINVVRVRAIAFAIGVALAAVAGALLIIVQPMSASSSDNLTILAFVVIALGGLGSYKGATVAAFLLGVVQAAVGYLLGGNIESVLPFVLLILIMLLWPRGIQRST